MGSLMLEVRIIGPVCPRHNGEGRKEWMAKVEGGREVDRVFKCLLYLSTSMFIGRQ